MLCVQHVVLGVPVFWGVGGYMTSIHHAAAIFQCVIMQRGNMRQAINETSKKKHLFSALLKH